ncbi:MAG: aminotransferase class III-fold pyridoxal phosphate-dependent enzyme [Bacteriovoracaceae bacterium]|jgi:taurine---2-oxoglutarate transaminase|nr:aminotransferase class III-fold pyridoxal phosphate-dependent enzyme [Bacteriovoracaceae bacterium]
MKNYFYTWTDQSKAKHFEFESAANHILSLKDNKKVYDLSSLSCQASFGHSCDEIIQSIQKQMVSFSMASPKADFSLKENVTNSLLKLLKLKGKIFYTVSGAESIENALKMARDIKQKKIIVARQKSYHGATLGALSVTGDWRNLSHETLDDWTLRIPEPKDDPDATQAISLMNKCGVQKIAAICLETVTGGNGVFLADQKWWDKISSYCNKKQIFLILDEVLCGFYRTGPPFGFQDYNLRPDFVTLSKSITGGYIPFGAVYTSLEVAKYYDDHVLSCGLTNYAHPLGLAALDAILKLTASKDFLENLIQRELEFESMLRAIEKLDSVKEVRYKGLLAAIDMHRPPSFDDFLNNGNYLMVGDKTIILAPALNYSAEDFKKALHFFKTTLENRNG